MSNIEDFIEYISYAPIDVRRAFNKVRELANLEKKFEEQLKETQKFAIRQKADEIEESSTEKELLILQLKNQIQRNHLFLLALHRERIASLEIIQQNYQKYIAQLDIEGEKFIEELKLLPKEQEEVARKTQREVKPEPQLPVMKIDKTKKTKRPMQEEKDIPKDPEQIVYCMCKQPGYGTMVACDSKNCSIEWFHLSCVGLEEVPDESIKWYCPNCRMMK